MNPTEVIHWDVPSKTKTETTVVILQGLHISLLQFHLLRERSRIHHSIPLHSRYEGENIEHIESIWIGGRNAKRPRSLSHEADLSTGSQLPVNRKFPPELSLYQQVLDEVEKLPPNEETLTFLKTSSTKYLAEIAPAGTESHENICLCSFRRARNHRYALQKHIRTTANPG